MTDSPQLRGSHLLQAIDDLSAGNRLHRDPEVERRLVELRHQAFAEVSKVPGRPTWPAVFPDPFPDVDGLPEAPAEHFSGDLLGGAITNHGCLHVRGLLDGPTVERVRSHIERSFEANLQAMRTYRQMLQNTISNMARS